MKISRGIKQISKFDENYNTFNNDMLKKNNDKDEIVKYVVWEKKDDSDDEDDLIKTVNEWPEMITLNASIEPENVKNIKTYISMIDENSKIANVFIYDNPKISPQSSVQKKCYSKIIIVYENTGKSSHRNETFTGTTFENFELELIDNIMFEKHFMLLEKNIQEIRKFDPQMNSYIIENGQKISCKIYPYGGFYEYGVHPKQIESCVFRLVNENPDLRIKISKLSDVEKTGIDPTKDSKVENGVQKFVGIKKFSDSQKINLYDEIKNGACSINIINTISDEKNIYKSCAITHIAHTNLITISFIKEKEEIQ